MKPTRIKVWPDLIYNVPASLYFQPLKENIREVVLDFTNCRYVNSSGLTIFLVHILKMVNQSKNDCSWTIEVPKDNEIFDRLASLGLFSILDQYIDNKDLFWPNKEIDVEQKIIVYTGKYLERLISVPVYTMNFKNHKNRRDVLGELKKWLLNKLIEHTSEFNLQMNQLILVLNEIVKNSADHTFDNSFIGMDFITTRENKLKICFSIGDLGPGIMKNVRDYLHETKQARAKYLSVDELYRWAIKYGNTTLIESKQNAGVGLPTIVEGSKPINFDLYVYDGHSCGYLNNISNLSHSSLRKNFYHLGNDVGFYYYGELIIDNE